MSPQDTLRGVTSSVDARRRAVGRTLDIRHPPLVYKCVPGSKEGLYELHMVLVEATLAAQTTHVQQGVRFLFFWYLVPSC